MKADYKIIHQHWVNTEFIFVANYSALNEVVFFGSKDRSSFNLSSNYVGVWKVKCKNK